MKYFIYPNGDKMPMIGLGTWEAPKNKVYDAVVSAVEAGYRHIDAAFIYGNEKEVGQALRDLFDRGAVKREELWITSKLWNSAHRKESVRGALENTLADLQLDYLDMYLVHWPVALKPGVRFPEAAAEMESLEQTPLSRTWEGMEECLEAGLTRHIGVSNFSRIKLEELSRTAKYAPEDNQIEIHPYLIQSSLVEYCRGNGICVTAYSPLGRGRVLKDPVVGRIADELNCTPAQVVLAWNIQRGVVVIPKSVTPERIRQNLRAGEIVLSSGQMSRIDALDKHERTVSGGIWCMEGSPYTLSNLWDE